MGIIIRQSIKASLFNYLGLGIAVLSGLFLLPWVLKPEEIGLIRILTDLSLLLAALSQLGLSLNMIRFYPVFNDETTSKNGFYFVTGIQATLGTLLFILLFLFNKSFVLDYFEANSPQINNYFYTIIPLAICFVSVAYYETLSSIFGRIALPKFIKEVFFRLLYVIIVVLYFYKVISFQWLIYSYIFIHVIMTVSLIIYVHLLQKIRFFPENEKKIERKKVSNYTKYTLITALSSLSGIIVSKLDIIMLGAMEGLVITGVYSIAFYIAMIIETPYRTMSVITAPILSEAINNKDSAKTKDIYLRSSTNLFAIGCLFFLLIYCNTNNIFGLMPNGYKYIGGGTVIFIIGLSKVFEMFSGLNNLVISFISPASALVVTIFLSVAGILSNFYFIPRYGMNGAAIATLISIVSTQLLIQLFVYAKVKLTVFTRKNLYTLFYSSFVFIIIYFIPVIYNNFIDLIIRSILLSSLFLIGIYFLKISEDFNSILEKQIQKFKS